MVDVRDALVLRWDNRDVWIRCPFHCDAKTHRHGTTLPANDRINSRAAHCTPTYTVEGALCQKDYYLVFPFESKQITDGLWWKLDRARRCWRTIGWGIDDPDHHVHGLSNDAVLQKDDGESLLTSISPEDACDQAGSDTNDLLSALSGSSLEERRQNQGKDLFDSYCITNDVRMARRILQHSKNPHALVSDLAHVSDKPVLLMACEEGHMEVVDFLLEQNPPLRLPIMRVILLYLLL